MRIITNNNDADMVDFNMLENDVEYDVYSGYHTGLQFLGKRQWLSKKKKKRKNKKLHRKESVKLHTRKLKPLWPQI